VKAGSFDARGEVAPIGIGERARHLGGTRCGHVRSGGEQLLADGANGRGAARGAGLDDHERDTRGFPQFDGDGCGKFPEAPGGDDEIVRRHCGHVREIGVEGRGAGDELERDFGERRVALKQGDGRGIGEVGVCGQGSGSGACSDIEDARDG